MRRLAGMVVVFALASVGCIGSTSSTGTLTTGDLPAGSHPATLMSIDYTVSTCPQDVSCVAASIKQKVVFIVSRELTCSPARGDYTDPAAACRALADVVSKLAKKDWACSCGASRYPGEPLPYAFGWYDGKRRTIPLDGCSLCNLRGIGGDLKLLMPGA